MFLTDIRKALSERILVLDGAMGTMLQRHGLSGNSEAFNISHPDIIESIHRAYIEAGADIIETNTFSANRISQSAYDACDSARLFALEGARIARRAADAASRGECGPARKVWVAGSMGPTGKSLSLSQDMSRPDFRPFSFDDMVLAYREQVEGLLEGGVDLLLLETCFDALNTKAAIYAIKETPGAEALPVMISCSVADKSGRMLTGQTIEAFYRSIEHCRPLSFGLNCSLGAQDLAGMVADVASWASCAVSCYPNAGLPNEMGAYDETPAQTASALRRMALGGCVNIVGGCCGTTPDHIRSIAEAVRGLAPRTIPGGDGLLHVSGLEPVCMDAKSGNFINIGERTNVAGSRRFARLIAEGHYDTALEVAAGQIEAGACVIDINMDDAMLDSTVQMERFLRHISNDPAVARAALMVDSSHWDTIVAGLKNAQGKCIVNSISLKEGPEEFLRKAREIRSLGAAVVVMAFDEKGQATTYDRKIEICARAYELLTRELDFPPCDIIFDVNVLSIGTGMEEHARYGVDFIEAVRWIKGHLPGALTSGGISNLSFAFRGNNPVREAMHSVFLYHAIKAGLDMGIVNPGMLRVYSDIEPELLRCVEDVVLDTDPDATERLIDKAAQLSSDQAGKPSGAAETAELPRSSLPLGQRLSDALVKGDSRHINEDVMEAVSRGMAPVDIIEGPLMAGMARVGELFGDGKMFLPQVVKSAKTMRDAVGVLQPYLEKDASESRGRRPKAVIATVKGDVHDIGKNITAIVLGCNGFEVTDLGVMVPKETILDEAERIGADIVCCSGLITPSLFQMEEICREMTLRGMSTPLLIGGATTSALHTAVKLSPLYDHVFYGSDASSSAVLAQRLLSEREETERAEHLAQEKIRRAYSKGARRPVKSDRPDPFPETSFLRGAFFDNIPSRELDIKELLPYFDWNLFHAIWGIKSNGATEQRAALEKDARERLDAFVAEPMCRIMLSARFDACHSAGDDIVSQDYRLPMLRQENGANRSLSDFVAPESYGFDSPMGMFAISVHRIHAGGHCNCEACSTEYDSLLERSLRLTLAEAASSYLDSILGRILPGTFRIIKPAAGYSSCPDHSLKKDILSLLPDAEKLEIRLSESYAMIPDASICGLIFVHPDASYPDILSISHEAWVSYLERRGLSEEQGRQLLGHMLG